MKRLLKACGLLVAGVLALLAIVVVVLLSIDLSRFKGDVERWVFEQTGEPFRIDGAFEPRLGRHVTLLVEDARLGESGGDLEAELSRLFVRFDLWSIWDRPLFVPELDIDMLVITSREGVEDDTPEDEDATAPPETPDGGVKIPLIVLGDVDVDDVRFNYVALDEAESVSVNVLHLDAESDPETGMIDLSLDGDLDGEPLLGSGSMGPLNGLLRGRDFRHDLDITIARLRLDTEGSVEHLATLRGLDVVAAAEGDGLVRLSQWFELPQLAEAPVRMLATAKESNGDIAVKVDASLARTRLSADATLSDWRSDPGLVARVEANAADVANWADLLGLPPLPHTPLDADLEASWRGNMVGIERLEVTAGGVVASARGRLPVALPAEPGPLNVSIRGPDLDQAARLFGVTELPAEPFSVQSDLEFAERSVSARSLAVSLGAMELNAVGVIPLALPADTGPLDITLRGPDLSHAGLLFGATDLPAEPFTASGNLRFATATATADTLTVQVGPTVLDVSGVIPLALPADNAPLTVALRGPDLARTARLFGVDALPSTDFELSGQLVFHERALTFRALDARVAELVLEAEGDVPLSSPAGERLSATLAVPDLGRAGDLFGLPGLAGMPADITARAVFEGEDLRLEDVAVELGVATLHASGAVPLALPVDSARLNVSLDAPDLGRTAGALGFEGFPSEPLSASTSLRIDPETVSFDNLRAALGDLALEARGDLPLSLPADPGRLVVSLKGTDLDKAAQVFDVDMLPGVPFDARADLAFDQEAVTLQPLEAQLGDLAVSAAGRVPLTLPADPSELSVSASGQNLGGVLALFKIDQFEDEPFSVQAKLTFDADNITLESFEADVSESNAEGALSVDFTDPPRIRGDFRLSYVNGENFFSFDPPAEEEEETPELSRQERREQRIIPQDPLPFEVLDVVDADVAVRVDRYDDPNTTFRDLQTTLRVVDGNLDFAIDDAELNGGRLTGRLTVRRDGEQPRVTLTMDGKLLRLARQDRLSSEAASRVPPFNLDVNLKGGGFSLHEIASGVNGRLAADAGAGREEFGSVRLLERDFITQVNERINPFARQDGYVDISCQVVHATAENGLVRLGPMLYQSSRVAILGRGRVNLGSERLDIRFATRPRRGVGVGMSSLAPFVKISGTMADPRLTVNTTASAISGGAAILTGGLSLLGESLTRRFRGIQDQCPRVQEAVAKGESVVLEGFEEEGLQFDWDEELDESP